MSDPTRRRWFRFSLRTLLIAVAGAVFFLIVTAIHLSRRGESLQDRSQQHLVQAAMLQEVVNALEQMPSRNAKQDALLQKFQTQLNYHADLSLQCEEAIWRPWKSVDETESPP